MGSFDKIAAMKKKAEDLAWDASDMAEKFPRGEGAAEPLDEVSEKLDEITGGRPASDD